MSPQQLVSQNVFANVSTLVSTLAAGAYLDVHLTSHQDHGAEQELRALFASAAELAAPVDDWEETARQDGWHLFRPLTRQTQFWYRDDSDDTYSEASNLCVDRGLDVAPHPQREVQEHRIVSPELAEKLISHGEKVDTDFAGLTIWARTTTGQAIYADAVIEAIAAEVSL